MIDDVSKRIEWGLLYLNQKRYELAIEEFHKILKINPRQEFIRHKLIQIHFQQKRYDLAKEEAYKLLEINPSNIAPYQELGNIYLEEGDCPQALTYFQKVLQLYAQQDHTQQKLLEVYKFESYINMGRAYLLMKKYNLAIESLKMAKELNSQEGRIYKFLPQAYIGIGEYELAIEGFHKALEINLHDEVACYNLIHIYLKHKRYALAKEAAQRFLGINSSSAWIHHELGNIYLKEEDYSQAITYFQKVLQLYAQQDHTQQKLLEVYINMGRAYLLMKKYNLAIESFKKAMELCPEDERIYKFLPNLYLKSGDYNSVTDVLSKKYDLCIGPKLPFIKGDISGKRIKILRIPNFYGSEILSTEMNSIMIPPLALGNIVAYIRSQGIPIDQDDLHIKTHYDNYFGRDEERIDESVFFDIPRVIEYVKGKDDPQVERIMDRVSGKTDLQEYKIVLFSIDFVSMNYSHAMFALCLARYLKRRYNPIIILGGMNDFVKLMRKNGCDWSDIDYVICGEGEEVVVDLLLSLLNNSPLQKGRVEENGRVIYATEVPRPVRPDFDGLPLDRYRYRGLKVDYCKNNSVRDIIKEFNESKVLLLPFRFIKGCTNKCIFCESSLGGLIHVTPASTVADWLKELQTRYNPTGYLFFSDTLNVSKKYVDQLCDEIIKRKLKIRWSDCARVDRLDKESIYKMREAGCIRLVFGMETASRRLLNYVDKDIDLKQLEDALYWADRSGIWTGIEVISGLPSEKEEDVDETISFIKHNWQHIDAFYAGSFYLKEVSLMRIYAERYGITNIFELLSYEDGFGTFVKYGFDEINGLKWPEKRKQILSASNKVTKTLGRSPFPEHEYESFLFFLYANYADKRVIKDLFYSVGKEKIRYLNVLRGMRESEGRVKGSADKTLVYG